MNNAAVVHGKSLMDSDDDALLKSQHINTMGQFWVRPLGENEAGGEFLSVDYPYRLPSLVIAQQCLSQENADVSVTAAMKAG